MRLEASSSKLHAPPHSPVSNFEGKKLLIVSVPADTQEDEFGQMYDIRPMQTPGSSEQDTVATELLIILPTIQLTVYPIASYKDL